MSKDQPNHEFVIICKFCGGHRSGTGILSSEEVLAQAIHNPGCSTKSILKNEQIETNDKTQVTTVISAYSIG